ncbi:CCR4-NOT transcription complex subunit 2-like isoform X2 [Liolophura sinensis]|uniref:CCR4-NOT transcription complex subunit 2-like isoform X2 n=1 Tax=Liolophura sinensis TaxID=3198878 RepID=UPI00315840B2
MAFRYRLDAMSGMGQFGADQFSTWNAQFGLNRKNPTELSPGARKNQLGMVDNKLGMMGLQQQKARKSGFFGDQDDDNETSMFFSNHPTMFRPDKELMPSQSPSQLSSAFSGNFYNQPPASMDNSMGNIALPQRALSGAQFQRNITPTSMNPSMNFPVNLQQQQPSPNRNLIQAIGHQRNLLNQNQVGQAMSNLQKRTSLSSQLSNSGAAVTSMSGFNLGPGRGHKHLDFFSLTDDSQPSLDLSEFPTLGNRSVPSNPIATARNYVNMVSKQVVDSTPEFQIQQEDFPALPGAQNPPVSSSSDSARKTPTTTAGGSYEQAVSKEGTKFSSDKITNSQQKRGIQTHPDGRVSNIPSGMVMDQFGIVGLLTFIRAAETEPNLVALSPGIDLTTLGLNLNCPENLYSTFQSPWADSPCRPQDIDFHVPSEYLTNMFIREKVGDILAPIKLNRYGEDLLFFLFYMYGGDVLQLAVAAELYNRDWRYHKEERIWITRAQGVEPIMKTNSYERGTYYFFDAHTWKKVAKDFYLEYDKLEDRPHLPPSLHHNPNQPVIAH